MVHPVCALLALGPARTNSFSCGLAFDAAVPTDWHHIRSIICTGSCAIASPGAAFGMASFRPPGLRGELAIAEAPPSRCWQELYDREAA